jgi:hypothetical protein
MLTTEVWYPAALGSEAGDVRLEFVAARHCKRH